MKSGSKMEWKLVVEFQFGRWHPSDYDLFRILHALGMVENEKYPPPRFQGWRKKAKYVFECCRPASTYPNLQPQFQIPGPDEGNNKFKVWRGLVGVGDDGAMDWGEFNKTKIEVTETVPSAPAGTTIEELNAIDVELPKI